MLRPLGRHIRVRCKSESMSVSSDTWFRCPWGQEGRLYPGQTDPSASRSACRIQNPDIPRAGRGGAAHGRAAGRSGAGQGGTPTGRFAQEAIDPFAFQGIEDNCP